MAGSRTYVKCPTCGGFGSNELGGYCKNHVPEKESKHIFDSYIGKYDVEKPFFSDTFGIIKDKFDIER